MLRANMALADNTEESADDMTAAETAPKPMNVTQGGHRYCMTFGRMNFCSSGGTSTGPDQSVWFQSGNKTRLSWMTQDEGRLNVTHARTHVYINILIYWNDTSFQ